jgi:tetratricopeptide (TPR) repeat protein
MRSSRAVPFLPRNWSLGPFRRLRRGTAILRIRVDGGPGTRTIRATLTSRKATVSLPEVPLDNRPIATGGQAEYPNPAEELATRILDLLDPKDGAPWRARLHVSRAMRRWDLDPAGAASACQRELLAAQTIDPLGPVVNYALGALAYNRYTAESTERSIDHFDVANAPSNRLVPQLAGLRALSLTGAALANCQLYHRFGFESANVLDTARNSATMAAEVARNRLDQKTLSRQERRNATEGKALAQYAEAFSQHITEEYADVQISIPLYEAAIATLRTAHLAVPPVLYNNLGYQHMTLAGLRKRGSDRNRYLKAKGYFQKAIAQSPEFHFAWANLGNVDRMLGEPGAAEASYRKALELAAQQGIEYPPGWNELACVLLKLGGRDAEAAQAHEKALNLAGNAATRAKLHADYGQSLIMLNRLQEGIAIAQLGMDEDPGNRHCLRTQAEAEAVE